MANVNRPDGFRPVKTLNGTPWTAMMRMYNADAARSATNGFGSIFIGDVVTLEADGNVAPAASNGTVLGVVVGVGSDASTFGDAGYFNPDNLTKRYLAYNEAGVVAVIPANGVLFEAQTTAALTLATGAAADFTATAGVAHGSTTTGNSSTELKTSVNGDVTVVEQVTRPDNDKTLANGRYIVQFTKVANAQ